jgi:cytosine/adenosine deaminase-related metal-dependent hydrolase
VWESMRLTAMVQKQQERDATFLPVRDALRLATEEGMAALGFPQGGRLEPGGTADIVLVDVSGPHCRPVHDLLGTLVYGVRASDVVHVVVDGALVVEHRRLLTVELPALLDEIDARASRLADRSHGRTVQVYAP